MDQNPSNRSEPDRTPESQSALNALLDSIEETAKASKTRGWELGDLLVRLQDEFNEPLSVAATRTQEHGYNENYLYELAKVAREFPASKRDGLLWYSCQQSIAIHKKMPKEHREATSPEAIARRMKTENVSGRQIRRTLALEKRKKAHEDALELPPLPSIDSCCRNLDCRKVIPTLEDGSVNMFWFDPPYSSYQKDAKTGRLVTAGSYGEDMRADCDNNTRDQAQQLVIDVLGMAGPKLAPEGCMVLWQAGGKPDNWRILQAAEENGWVCPFAGLWDKSQAQPGNLSEPFSISTERFLVLYRGRKFKDHSLSISGRRDVIDEERISEFLKSEEMERLKYKSVTREFQRRLRHGSAELGDCHVMIKPPDLNEFFVSKLTKPGELIADLCGCSGSMCLAAAKLGRQWLYCESNEKNYVWGHSRLARDLAGEDD